jgi:HlyD family secretion protein
VVISALNRKLLRDRSVFVLEGTRARLRQVQIGQRNNEEAEVVEGVGVGDLVILHPPDTLADGSRVARRAR